MSQLIFSVVCSPFRKRASNMPSAADPPGRSGRSRFRPAAGRFGKSPSSWRRNIRCRIMRHLIFSIVGSPPESPSVNPPGAGTIGSETEYQVGHNVPPDILIGMPASLLLLACSPRPGVARQHERFPENDSPWLHSRVNLPNAQSNDCARSPTNDGNGNATGRDLAAGSLNAPLRPWWLPYTKLFPPYHSPAQRRFGISTGT